MWWENIRQCSLCVLLASFICSPIQDERCLCPAADMILVGNVHKAADPVPEGFNIYGETKGTPSKLLPSGSVSTFLGANVEGKSSGVPL